MKTCASTSSDRAPPGFLRRGVAGALVIGAVLACAENQLPTGPLTYEEQFEVFWQAFDSLYPYFEYKRYDWDSVHAELLPRLRRVTSQFGLIGLMTEAVRPLQDRHVQFVDPTGWAHGTDNFGYAYPNFDWTILGRIRDTGGWIQSEAWGYARLDGVIPYIAIEHWGDGFTVAAFDQGLERFRNDTALILDIRMNSGGYESLTWPVAGRFTSTSVIGEYVQTRSGPSFRDLTDPQPRYVHPRGPWQFNGRVALLVGREVYSASETFVSAMRELPNVLVIGDRTGGSTGSPVTVRLGGGWTVNVPSVMHRTADMRVIEGQGILPDAEAPWYPEPALAGRDTVIEFARTWIACPACVAAASR